MKRIISIVLICISAVGLAGCWDRMEVGSITFPLTIALDRNPQTGSIRLYAQVAKTTVGPEGQMVRTYETLEADGENLTQAMYRITDRAEQRISWKQVIVIVISENFARQGLSDVIDLLSRFTQIRLNCYLLVTNENLKELLGGNPKVDIGRPTPLAGISIAGERTGKTDVVSLKDFFTAYLSDGREPVIPKVSIAKREGDKIQLEFEDLGVFKGDRLVGFLTREETMGFLWVSQKPRSGYFSVPCVQNRDKTISVNPLQTMVRIVPGITGGKPSIAIEIQAEYGLIELTCPIALDTKGVQEIDRGVEKYIKKQILYTIRKSQETYNADIFGFGERIYRKYPQYWYENKDNWEEIYRDMEVTVSVKARLRRTGETSDSFAFEPRRSE